MSRTKVVAGGTAPPTPLGLRSESTWGDYTRGMHVTLQGRDGEWRFYQYTSTDMGEEWVTVYGGDTGNAQFTSVYPEEVSIK